MLRFDKGTNTPKWRRRVPGLQWKNRRTSSRGSEEGAVDKQQKGLCLGCDEPFQVSETECAVEGLEEKIQSRRLGREDPMV